MTWTPLKMLAVAVVAAAICLEIFAAGWSRGADGVQGKWDAAKAAQMQVALAAEQDARDKEHAMHQRLQEAEHAATEREKTLRADAAAAHATARGLRDTLAAIGRELPAAPIDACRATADAALAVLSECADRYQRVAEAADGHASDVRLLMDAWPQ